MQPSVVELARQWHDFYVLAGTAAATLVGLMFVVATVGANLFNESNLAGIKAFITPTVVVFSAVLVICLLIVVPTHTTTSLSGLLAAIAMIGLVYSGWILGQFYVRRTFKLDLTDRVFYALIPVVGHLLVLASSVMLYMQWPAGWDVLAGALITLMLGGIRNAWDMTTWIVIKSPGGGSPTGTSSAP